MMDIVHKNDRWEPAVGEYKNCIVLYNDHWNDYCYMTTFHAVYCDKHGKCVTIGDVKIYYYDFDKKRTKNYGRAVSSVINEKITQLSEKFCSLGQTLNYYQQLKNAVNISLDKGCYWFISYQFETHQLLMPHTWLLEAYEKLKQINEE